jgi:AraC family transcriptional regulator
MVANEAFGQDINLHIDHALVPNPILERRLDDYLGRATDQRDTPSTMEMDARAVLIGIELLRNHSVRPLRPPQHGGLAPWQVRKVSDFIEANLARDVPLAELASLIRLSPYHFCRAFGRSTGLPPHRWLQARRIEAAKLHLARDDRTILEIAAMVGYDNPGHFAKVFRRLVGVTPREFRRRS